MNVLFTLALILVAILALVAWIASRPRGAQLVPLGNVGEGFQPADKTFLTDAAIGARGLLVKKGTDANHVALCGVGDIPLAFTRDEASAAEEIVTCGFLGLQKEGAQFVASAAIADGDLLVAAANGKVRTLPGAAGTYYIIGRAIKLAAADGDPVEAIPCFPIQRVVA